MRLIDADALIERWNNMSVRGRTEFDQEIMVAPSIDIVCCGECKYWKDFECQCDWASTDHEGGASYSLYRNADDFCSYGEREGE